MNACPSVFGNCRKNQETWFVRSQSFHKIIAAHELLTKAVGGEIAAERVRRSLARIGEVRRRFAGD